MDFWWSERRDLNPRPSPWQGGGCSTPELLSQSGANVKQNSELAKIIAKKKLAFSAQFSFYRMQFHQGLYRGQGIDIKGQNIGFYVFQKRVI